jgi:hypothetical protein
MISVPAAIAVRNCKNPDEVLLGILIIVIGILGFSLIKFLIKR